LIALAAPDSWTVATLREIAFFFDVSEPLVRQSWVDRGMPGERGSYDLRAIAKWRHQVDLQTGRRQNPRISGGDETDPLLSGPVSPALEKFREERAKIACLERKRMEGQLVELSVMDEFFGRVAGLLKSAGDALQHEFGEPAYRVLVDAIDEAEREATKVFGERDLYRDSSGEGDSASVSQPREGGRPEEHP